MFDILFSAESLGSSSASEPRLCTRRGTLKGGTRARLRLPSEDRGEAGQGEASKRLARIKVGSKKTFKFRKTRRRDLENGSSPVSPTIVEQSPPLPTATATTQTPTSLMTTAEAATTATASKQSTTSLASKTFGPLKPVSLTATVIKRAKQKHKKLSQKPRACAVDIVVDDDSLSSLGTSSTMGYRDSFGDNDDGCFHLLERSVEKTGG